MTTLTDQIRALAARDIGMSSADVEGCSRHRASWLACKLARRGEIHGVRFTDRTVRYFADPAMADAFRERVRARVWNSPKHLYDGVQAAQWPADAPVAGYHPDYKFTECPSFEPRWEMQPLPLTAHNGAQRGVVINEACHA